LYPIVFQALALSDARELLFNYAAVYFFSGISAFDDFLKTGTPIYECILSVPKPLNELLQLTGAMGPMSCPSIFEDKYVPLATNVYTVFFQAYHDFGLVGVALYCVVVGSVSTLFYVRGYIQGSYLWRFGYCILFFSTAFSFFEDQYSRGAIYYFFALVVIVLNISLSFVARAIEKRHIHLHQSNQEL
jgi:oligosaccharide repeat unit polymerase